MSYYYFQLEVEVTLPGEGRDRTFSVAIKWMSRIALHSLRLALEGRMHGIPFQTVQALDVVMRHLPSMRYARYLMNISLLQHSTFVIFRNRSPQRIDVFTGSIFKHSWNDFS